MKDQFKSMFDIISIPSVFSESDFFRSFFFIGKSLIKCFSKKYYK